MLIYCNADSHNMISIHHIRVSIYQNIVSTFLIWKPTQENITCLLLQVTFNVI